MTSPSPGVALITGASAGIGAIYAERLAQRGYDLVLVARNRERLHQLAARIVDTTGREVRVLVADLADPQDVATVEQELRDNPRLSVLVNNAGVGATHPLLDSSIESMRRMITLNVEALTQLTYAAVPGLVARGSGTIINIASIVAVAPEILNGVYGASKAYVLAFSQSLRHELADKGVRVQVVLPGATATEFWDNAGLPISNVPQDIIMSAANMVDAALAGLDQGEFATVPALPDAADWNAYEQARQVLLPQLSRATPAARYGIGQAG
ncbi:MAG: SDR family NAD(P)-dependent oxidoreductase [Lysobacter sp.]